MLHKSSIELIANFSIKKSHWNNMAQLLEIDIVFIKLALNYWHWNPDLTKLRLFWRILSNPYEIPNFSFVVLKEIHFWEERGLDFLLSTGSLMVSGRCTNVAGSPHYWSLFANHLFFLWEPALLGLVLLFLLCLSAVKCKGDWENSGLDFSSL